MNTKFRYLLTKKKNEEKTKLTRIFKRTFFVVLTQESVSLVMEELIQKSNLLKFLNETKSDFAKKKSREGEVRNILCQKKKEAEEDGKINKRNETNKKF